jgi:hypothetical protein
MAYETVTAMARDIGRTAADPLSGSAKVNVGSTERLLSIAGGVLLFGWGMYRRGPFGYGAMMTAAALWDRGMRGHCAVYAALGKTTAEPPVNGAIEAARWPTFAPVGRYSKPTAR